MFCTRYVGAPLIVLVSLGFVSLLAEAVGADQLEESVVIKAGTVHLGDGQVMSPGMVLVTGNKIAAVGQDIAVPAETRVIETAHLTPGFVDAATSVGVAGGAGELTSEVTVEFEVADAVDLKSRTFRQQVDQGITTVHVTPSTDNVVAGFGALLKTAGEDESQWLNRKTGLLISMCNDPTSRNSSRSRPESLYVRQPTNRMGVVWILRARFHSADKAATEQASVDQSSADGVLQSLIAGSLPCFAVSRTSYDIETLFRIGQEFGFKPILVGGDESYKVLDLLKREKASVIFTGLSTGMTGPERTELKWNTVQQLANANIPVAIAGDQLLQQARFARRFGMDAEQALVSITSRPAEILGVGDRVGRIQVGFDADLVAFAGEPLQATSAIQWVMIDGKTSATIEDQGTR